MYHTFFSIRQYSYMLKLGYMWGYFVEITSLIY